MADLHFELLSKFDVRLCSDGKVLDKDGDEICGKQIVLGYRDEGPDAWAGSDFFPGPAWVSTTFHNWEFWEDGVKITGYDGLYAKIVYIKNDEVHVVKCIGEEY